MISVCIATYNGEKYILKQIESILSQIGDNDEVIISDDGSKDRTIKIIESINDSRIRIFINKGPHGFTPNFQNAILHSKGDIIFTADQDDVWYENKVQLCLKWLEQFDLIVSDATVVDGNLNVIDQSYWHIRRPYFNFWGNFLKCGHLGCCLAFRRNILYRLLPFPQDYPKCPHDLWIIMICLAYYKTKFIDHPLIYYRRHGKNVSNAGFKNETTLWFKLAYRAYLLTHLIRRVKIKTV